MAGLYIHIPYCYSKCAYCDFYSMPQVGTMPRYIDALVAETGLRAGEITEPYSTIYIGGGTPSILGADNLARLLDRLSGVFDFSAVGEITVEVNPEDVTRDFLHTLRRAGVNRISMGVQSFSDDELRLVGRRHTAMQAFEAALAIKESFDNFSLDLIFGLPGQTLGSLDATLKRMLELDAPHLSAYLLSYEQGTKLYASLMAGKVVEASDELAHEMYLYVHDALSSAGYHHYEISNYARPGMESRHNSSYWNSVPYLGLGASAHSYDGDLRRYNLSNIKEYLSTIESGNAYCLQEPENDENKFNDYIITRLRTSSGIDKNDLANRPFGYLAPQIDKVVQQLVDAGELVMGDSGNLAIPHTRWLTSDAVIRELIL
ncbi:MAG: radical SAM family heme chaperone HemW [Bacteroides sp.]|nr:radical SAM family heme chaperone HemW [Bacteroides sp.]